MSHYKPYPAYKDSGVEWLGRVPDHWEQIPLKWVFDCLDGMRVPLNASQRAEIPGETPYWGSGGVVGHISKCIFDEALVLLGEDGAPFFDKDRPVAYEITGKSWINNHIHVLRSNCDVPNSWLVHYLNSVEYRLYIDGSTRDKLTQEDMKSIVLLVPPKDEVLQALKNLDRETTRIDALIAKKTRFIELLKEKRQALITKAVTKGLNPNVKMKDSGVEWLGEVPEHWGVSPLKYIASLVSGGTPSKEMREYWDGDVPWASAKDLKQDKLADTQDHITMYAISSNVASLVPAGCILVVVRGMILARTFPVSEAMVPMAINQDLKALITKRGFHSGYLANLLRGLATETLSRLEEAGHGTKALRMENWVSIQLPIPPIDEQQQILDFIERETTRLDLLVSKSEHSIALLKERRSALITAAVTGQIDLREAA
jgi:type I restriction enzyme S subunit